MDKKIPVEISARHAHLSQNDLWALFGGDYQLRKLKQLTQPCDFAAEEKIDILGPNGQTLSLRIVGPVRPETQVEISLTDAFYLGLILPIKESGHLEGSPGTTLIGPKGQIKIAKGAIAAKRHIHCNPKEAEELMIKSGDLVSIKIGGERSLILNNILVRVRDDYRLCLHLDTDEGNAAGVNKSGNGEII